MKLSFKRFSVWLGAAWLLGSAVQTHAFALLGPVQPWMQATNGVIQPGDIGGPMDIGSGYRWNVPVVTYGFDKSFLDYFGSNGVASVESAIKILNDLPAASSIVLTNYPFESRQASEASYTTQARLLYDLKSQTLSLLLEHLGLAEATRNILVIRQWTPDFFSPLYNYGDRTFFSPEFGGVDWGLWAIPDFVAVGNIDPQTLGASHVLNGTFLSGIIWTQIYRTNENGVIVYPPSVFANTFTAASDGIGEGLNYSIYYTGLTSDDVGGLRYLFSTNTINYETLLFGVQGGGINSNSFVNGAWRPGVDKITFVPQPTGLLPGAFLPMTNEFTDTYITNGQAIHQQLQRVITRPDFHFSVSDTGQGNVATPSFVRTGTTNWINNSVANGSPSGEGPGIIQPPVQITFNKAGQVFSTQGKFSDEAVGGGGNPWASFDGSTNAPVVYPIPRAGTNELTLRMWLERGTPPSWSTTSFEWKPASAEGAQFAFQTSTNLTKWIILFTVTNNGSVCTYFNDNPASPSRFYRLVPQ